MYLKLNNKLLSICYLFVGWMPEPTRQTKLLKDGKHFWASSHVRLCFGFPNYVGFREVQRGNQNKEKRITIALSIYGCSWFDCHYDIAVMIYILTSYLTAGQCLLACFFANSCKVSSYVTVSSIGQLPQLLRGGTTWYKTQLLLQNICTLGSTRNSHLPS